ncbi:hypothetical protein [Kitasatospora sp. NPDC002040]|uniref:hypothetical protein n=1 Tax=Kitasatospora sp. NPDC002040 TaxID=3154661 RepID=UPI00333355BC
MIVGVLLLLVGVPVGLFTARLQDDLGKEEPRFTARYSTVMTDGSFVLPTTVALSSVEGVTNPCDEGWKWARQQGAVDIGTSRIDVEAVPAKDRTVAIRNIRTEIVGTPRPPEKGTVVTCRAQGEGTAVDVGLDLDGPTHSALKGTVNGVSYLPYFDDRFHFLENQQPELFKVTAMAAEQSYDYVIKVEGSVDGKDRTWTLKDGDKPFRISGVRKGHANHLVFAGIWTTEYTDEALLRPARCTDKCQDQDGKLLPVPPAAAAAPSAVPAVPKRPDAAAPPLTVIQRDAESVAIAWAVTRSSVDISRDKGRIDALPRTKPYVTGQLYARQLATREANKDYEPDNPVEAWARELYPRKAWTQVRSVRVRMDTTRSGPKALLTDPSVDLEVEVWFDWLADDGWKADADPADLKYSVSITLERQPDGTYLVSGCEESGCTF